MFNKRRVKRAMEKKRKQKHMPFKSDNYTDFFYCKANFDELRLSVAQFKVNVSLKVLECSHVHTVLE